MTAPQIIQVALPVPRGDSYDYLCDGVVSAGMRVLVPFGPRKLVGMVVGDAGQPDLDTNKLRSVIEILDADPLVDAAWLDLLRFAANYYQGTLGMAIATALPSLLRKGKPALISSETRWQLTAAGREATPEQFGRAARQALAIAALRHSAEPLPARAIGPEGTPRHVLQTLAGKGLVEAAEHRAPIAIAGPKPRLNAEQQQCVDRVTGSQGFTVHLLEGVTGSGKTEVYLELARAQIAQSRQCLFLVPEIGLTPQMVERVRQGTGARVLALHSGMSDTERHNAWLTAREGGADIILGTRSALFVPLPRLGLIIVDEEHDTSYKQQDGIRYNARDLAVRRAQQHDVNIILGSATPSLESSFNAQMGRYVRHELQQRHGAGSPPRLQIIDLRGQTCQDGLSPVLIARLREHLDRGGQALLFINRRGFSPALLCHDCGWTALCERCDARLTSHRRSHSLRCHHCGHQRPQPRRCPDCNSDKLQHLGQGTERVEQRIAALWPGLTTLRLDRDNIARRGELEDAIARIRSGEVRIIIGTQLMAKGHDFPALSMVGIIDADQGLYGQDFRATEYLAQQVIQVAGRAGRRDAPGEVLLQTHNPDHPLLQQLREGAYGHIAESLLGERQMMNWPPFSRLALLRAESGKANALRDELQEIASLFYGDKELEVLGPVPAVMERKAGQYRYHVLFRSQNRRLLQQQLSRLRDLLTQRPGMRSLRWSIDVDPQWMD